MTSNIWSDNKYINGIINILVFLLAINIFHCGQFILPIICLILFIDNKFKFKVANLITFIILCLFSIGFFLFSYRLGFYSVMGFCLPMAYYIGSNIKNINEENIKRIIYIIAFGMAAHVVLNFVLDYSVEGLNLFTSHTHRDIWTMKKIKATTTSVNYALLIGSIYYLLTIEKSKKIKYIGLILFVILFIYNVGLGRRTPILMALIAIVFSIVFSLVMNKKVNKKFLNVFLTIIGVLIIFVLLIYFNIFGLKDRLSSILLIDKFLWLGLKAERLEILVEGMKHFISYPWGGKMIAQVTGDVMHDIWSDIYDFAGIVPYLLFIIYTIKNIVIMIKLLISKKDGEFLLLITCVSLCILMQCMLEPIMTGSSIFAICFVLIFAMIEKYHLSGVNKHE